VLDLMLSSRFPMFVAWGPELGFLYNEAYAAILGAKHPEAMGKPFRAVWPEIWDDISPLVDTALGGEATWSENLPLVMLRNGYPEQTYYTFSYSPLRDGSGHVAGMFCACTETTGEILAERRANFRLALDDALRGLSDPVAITQAAAEALGRELGASRVGYGEIVGGGAIVSVKRDWVSRPEVASLAGEAAVLEAFGPDMIAELRAGKVLVVEDCLTDPRAQGEASAATWASIGCRALIAVPLERDGSSRPCSMSMSLSRGAGRLSTSASPRMSPSGPGMPWCGPGPRRRFARARRGSATWPTARPRSSG
jgi:hypothetical protein